MIGTGIGHISPDLDWDPGRDTIAVNVEGFAAAANFGLKIMYNTETPGTTAACVATMGLDWIKPFKALLPLERELPKLRRAPDQVGDIVCILENQEIPIFSIIRMTA